MTGIRCVVIACAAIAAASPFGIRLSSQEISQDPAAQLELATQLYGSAKYRDAIDAYDRAITSEDESLIARARKGKVRSALRIAEFDVAWREAELLNDDDAADTESRTLLGDALWAMGLFDEADAAYRQALVEQPESTRARFGLARSLLTRNQLDEALSEALVAAKDAPDDLEIHALVGTIYEQLNRYVEAVAAFDRYLALLPRRDVGPIATINEGRVRLLKSFNGRVPLEIDARADDRVYRARFRLVDKKIVVQGSINRVPVDFVLDTGAERTGVSDVTARRAGISVVSTTWTAGVGVGGLGVLSLARADSIEVAGLRIRNVPVAIRRAMRGMLPRWQNESLSPLALGLSVAVDYDRREVILARRLPDADADVVLPMRMNRLPMVRGLLNSKHPAYFVVDTGGEMISISAETATALAMKPPRRIPLRVYGMSGLDPSAFLLPGVDLDFDEIEYRKVGLAVLDLRAPSVLLGFQVGGIVGHQFLSGYRVSMDMGRSELRLARRAG